MRLYLKLITGEHIKQTIEEPSCTIGRSSKCTVVIPHEAMSRQHCMIEFLNGEYYVTDMGSTNGVLINGDRIIPHKRTPYMIMSSLAFGAVQSLQIEEEKTGSFENPLEIKEPKDHPVKTASKTWKKSPGPPPRIIVEDNRFKHLAMNLLAFGILAAAMYWFYVVREVPIETPKKMQRKSHAPKDNYEYF